MVLGYVTAATATPPLITTHTVKEHRAAKRPPSLVSDDNHVNQKLAAKLVEKLGYRADVVADGKEALSQVAYAAVLMDCQMPEMDVFTASQRIREQEQRKDRHLPIITMQGDRVRCIAAGMDDYVSKPINTAALKAALDR